MLAESLRVLTPGGRAIYSVWGDKENSLQITLAEEVRATFGIESGGQRDSWHLNDRSALLKMFEEAGFVDITLWQNLNILGIRSATHELEECRFLLSGGWPEDKKDQLEQAIQVLRKKRENARKEQHRPMSLNHLFISASKPLK